MVIVESYFWNSDKCLRICLRFLLLTFSGKSGILLLLRNFISVNYTRLFQFCYSKQRSRPLKKCDRLLLKPDCLIVNEFLKFQLLNNCDLEEIRAYFVALRVRGARCVSFRDRRAFDCGKFHIGSIANSKDKINRMTRVVKRKTLT